MHFSHKSCFTKRRLLHAIHMGLQLCEPGEDMMAAHRCQQITNAQQYQRKYGRKHGRKYPDGFACSFIHGTFNQLLLQLHSPQSTKCHLIKYSRLWMISKKSRKMCFSMAFPDNLVCYSDTRPRGVRGIGFSNTGKCIPTFNPVVRSCWISSKNVNFSLAASISLARCMI